MAHSGVAPVSRSTQTAADGAAYSTVVGEHAADQATELYVEQERLTRRERFERIIRKAQGVFQ